MIKAFKTAIIIFALLGCNNSNKLKNVQIFKNGELLKGYVISDSIFIGKVNHYDSSSNVYLGFSTYKSGVEEGDFVNYYIGENYSDSGSLEHGVINNYVYRKDSVGHLTYKSNFYNGKRIGGVIQYDSLKRVSNYYFFNFEGDIIYQCFKTQFNDSTFRDIGELVNVSLNELFVEGNKKMCLFLYILDHPYLKTSYELAVIDKGDKILQSKPINSKNCFYEAVLDTLPVDQNYAISLHTYNSFKKRDDLKIIALEKGIRYGFKCENAD
jgi:antitoxin component YwqK of YwqJK toxin-antitoxin module